MAHPRVEQLRFARSELRRALDGVADAEARRRFFPMNSISWMVGHLASQEHRYWLRRAQGTILLPGSDLDDLVGFGRPASTPPLAEMWAAWHEVTRAADPFLDALTTESLEERPLVDGRPHDETYGTMLQRVTYHYWYHIGESQAVRQLLGHRDLPDFVGAFHGSSPYRPEGNG
jgi:uncharacterized damage-inducible protein DinB